MRLATLALFVAAAAPVSGGAEADRAVEQRIVAAVEASKQEAIALIEATVNVNSGTLNFEGVRRVGSMFAAELEKLGFATRWVDGAPFGRAGHLAAERSGDGPRVLLIGHLDTVFEPDSPFQRFERLNDREASGPGVTDMKGGNVVMLVALAALAEVGALDDLRVTVVLTGDEERSGRPLDLARAALVEPAKDADYAIGFEDGDSNPETAVVSRRGSSSWRLRVEGTPAHSSQIFQDEVGAGAIYEASRILTEFYRQLAAMPNLTFNPGVVLGGTQVDFEAAQARGTAFGKNNVVAEKAIVTGDLRAVSPEQYREATAAMEAIVADSLPGTSAEISFSEGYPPMAASEGNLRLLALYDEVSRDLGYGPVTAVDPRKAGAADVSFAAAHVPQVLDGIGLMGRGGHTVEEVADLETLPMQAARAAVLLYRLSRTSKPRESQALRWEPDRFEPVDEATDHPDLLDFRNRLQRIVAERDTAGLVSMSTDDVRLSFGGSYGHVQLRHLFESEDTGAPAWAELETVLALGGSFVRPSDSEPVFCAPYLFRNMPDLKGITTDPRDAKYDYGVVVGEDVALRSAPAPWAPVVARLSYAVVFLPDALLTMRDPEPLSTADWSRVETASGLSGFVAKRQVRKPLDYRACFVKVGGAWKLANFLEGD